jgi:predicted Zn-dependent protease
LRFRRAERQFRAEDLREERLPVRTYCEHAAQAEAIAWFGRAIGAARSADPTKAKEAIDQLRVLKDRLAKANDAYWTGQVVIQEEAAGAWLALAEGRKGDAIAAMRQAADLEDRSGKHVAMENLSRRCGNCSASCCSTRMSLRRR